MNSLVSSMKSVPNSTAETIEYLKKKGRLELWSGILGIRSLERAADEQAKNREAESAHVRRMAWGDNGKPAEGNNVNDTILGDMTTVHHHQQAPKSSMLGTIAAIGIGAGLMATGIGVPVGAWMLANGAKETVKEVVIPAEKPQTEERPAVNIGGYELRLGK